MRAARLAALPHEDPLKVERHRQLWRAELGVETPGEIEVGDSIALLRLKLKRIEEVEQRRLASEILNCLDDAPEMKILKMIESTLTALSATASIMATSFPPDRNALDALLAPVDTTLEVETAKERIALDLPLPGDPDVARRVRYRRDAERALTSEMEFLSSLRARGAQIAGSGSFGPPVPA